MNFIINNLQDIKIGSKIKFLWCGPISNFETRIGIVIGNHSNADFTNLKPLDQRSRIMVLAECYPERLPNQMHDISLHVSQIVSIIE